MIEKMNQEIKQKWVAALRSGKYQQAQHRLREDGNKFCCLGVLCDIIDPTKWEKIEDGECIQYTYRELYDSLRGDVADEVGLRPRIARSLASRNDAGESFDLIADWIEENL